MINLLPTEAKKDISYARRNTKLARWSLVLLLSLLGVGAVVVGGQFFMSRSINSYTGQLQKDRDSLKVQKLDETEKHLQDISSSVKLVIKVLQREILFSKLLKQLGSVIPSNAVLLQLQIDKVQGSLTLRASATDIDAATQLQVNLQDPNNKIFDKADIENITCLPPDSKVKYPCTVQIKVLFSKNNPFTFVQNGGNQ